jgi:hypothetical protein
MVAHRRQQFLRFLRSRIGAMRPTLMRSLRDVQDKK